MKLPSFIVLLILGLSTGSYGMDLVEMQKTALSNRPLVQQYAAELEKTVQDERLAKGGYYPSADVSLGGSVLDEASSTEDDTSGAAEARLSWNIFAGFRDQFTVESAQMATKVEEYRLQGIQQDLQLDVALAYLSVYERWANKRVAEAAYKTLEKVYRDGENRYGVGLIGKNELLKFRVDYDNADITLKAAEASLKKSVNSLSRQVGRLIQLDELDFGDFNTLPEPVDQAAYRKMMLAQRSELLALEAGIEASGAKAEAEKADYYPRLDAIGSYTKYNGYAYAGGDDESETRGQLVLSMNLFRGFTTEASVARARIETRSLNYQLEELKRTLLTGLDNLFIDIQVSRENVDVSLRSIEQAEENLRITQLKYDEGLQRESDLLDAITALSRAKYNHVAVLRTLFLNNFQMIRMVDGFNS